MLVELQGVLAEKNAELEDVRKKGGKSARVLDKAMKEIAACVSSPSGDWRARGADPAFRRRTTRLRSCLRSGSPSTDDASSRRLSCLWRRARSTAFRSM